MKIKYNLNNEIYSYTQDEKVEENKLNFLLTNNKGDFLNLGVQSNSSKFQGLNFCDSKTLEIFKVLDEILLPGLEVKEVEVGGYYIKREFASKISQVMHVPIETAKESDYDEDAKLEYSENGVLEEVYEDENEIVATDRFFFRS